MNFLWNPITWILAMINPFAAIYGGPISALIVGILAIIFAVKAKAAEPDKKGMNIASLVIGIVDTVWAGIVFIACVLLSAGAAAAVNAAATM
jgi:hypothetical protein